MGVIALGLVTVVAGIWLGRRRFRRARSLGAAVVVVAASMTLFAGFVRFAPLASPYERLPDAGLVVLDADGRLLQRDASAGLRIPVRLSQVAPAMVDATIAAEDERFESHPGVDPLAVGRALVSLPFHSSGASTLTQQLVRRLYLSEFDGPLLERKAREAVLALQIEARHSKSEILALYLNDVYYGRNAYGVEAAARAYFGVSAANLDLAQAAYLAGLPQDPVRFEADAAAARDRQRYVLDRLAAVGDISRAEASAAAGERLDLLSKTAPAGAPHFVAYALEELARLQPELAQRRDLVIETTLDGALQTEAEDIVRYNIGLLKDRSVSNGAVVALEPASGRLLAMVGSADFADDAIGGQINMTLQPRQPGSALKPFLYLTALGRGFTAASPLLDVPTAFDTASGPYMPLDADRRFSGVVPLRVALASSLNLPAVRTLDQIGIDPFLETLHRFGLGTLTDSEVYGLALTLGGGEVRLLDLTAAYGALANQGALVLPYAVERVRDQARNVLYEHRPGPSMPVAGPAESYLIGDILSDPEARRIGFSDAPQLRLPFAAAVKTGTTTEYRDNWTVGYTPERAVGVWVGNADNRPMIDVSGITGAGPIWRGVMETAHRGVAPSWPQPAAGLVRVPVCSPTGLLPGRDCPSPADEWFLTGTEPRSTETYYRRDATGRLLIDPPAEARAWASAAGLALANELGDDAGSRLGIFPPNGHRLYLARELRDQSVVLRASPPAGTRSVEFWIDGALVGTASGADASTVWRVEAGTHLLTVRASGDSGLIASDSTRFEVAP